MFIARSVLYMFLFSINRENFGWLVRTGTAVHKQKSPQNFRL